MRTAHLNTVARRLAVYAIFAALVMVLAGCASFKPDATPRDKYADAERTFQSVVDVATYGVKSGKLTGETLVLVKAALIEANGALIEMRSRIRTGDTVGADYWLARVLSAVNAAAGYLERNADTTTRG